MQRLYPIYEKPKRATLPTSEENIFPYFNVVNNTSNHSYIVHQDIIYFNKNILLSNDVGVFSHAALISERILMAPGFH